MIITIPYRFGTTTGYVKRGRNQDNHVYGSQKMMHLRHDSNWVLRIMKAWKNKYSKDTVKGKMKIKSLCSYQYVNKELKAFGDKGLPSSERAKMQGSIFEGHLCIRLGNK